MCAWWAKGGQGKATCFFHAAFSGIYHSKSLFNTGHHGAVPCSYLQPVSGQVTLISVTSWGSQGSLLVPHRIVGSSMRCPSPRSPSRATRPLCSFGPSFLPGAPSSLLLGDPTGHSSGDFAHVPHLALSTQTSFPVASTPLSLPVLFPSPWGTSFCSAGSGSTLLCSRLPRNVCG